MPVQYTDDVFQVLDLQDGLQSRYTGGTVQHVFLGEAVSDPELVKRFVRKVCENYRLPYFTLSPTFSICPQHGYLRGETRICPDCGRETEVYSRVVGYLRPVNQWNAGKQAEFAARSTFSITGKGPSSSPDSLSMMGKGSSSSLNHQSIPEETSSVLSGPSVLPTKETVR